MERNFARHQSRWWLVVAVAGLALAALTFAGRPGIAGAQDQAITIQNFAFSPSSIQVTAGSTITWTNNDSVAHTVTADDGSFDSGLIQPGASYSHTFDTAGTVAYHCSVHPNMTAEVVVMAAQTESTAPAAEATAPAPEQMATAVASTSSDNAAPAASTAASGVSGSTTLPNTGSGTGSGGHLGLTLLAIGVIGILGSTGVVARRRRNAVK